MRYALSGFLFLALLLVQGCAETVDPKNVHRIDESTTRAEVEALLGEPVHVEEEDDSLVYTYSYTIDADETGSLPDLGGCVGYCAMAFLLILPATWVTDASGVFDETETLLVAYGPDDRVVYAESGKRRDWRLAREQENRERQERLRLAAEQGDAEAMYALGKESDAGGKEQMHWYCQAAIRGNAGAQFAIGQAFAAESGEVERDIVKASLWIKAARANGYAEKQYVSQKYKRPDGSWACCIVRPAKDVLEEMTPAQIAEAERLATDWEPSAKDCFEPGEAQAAN